MCACVKPATHIYKEVHFENKGQFALGIAMIGEIRGVHLKEVRAGRGLPPSPSNPEKDFPFATVFKTRKLFMTLIRFVLHTESSNSSN